ncbi:GNAT family N-acetyltransferase [Muricauda sp. ANG21]|uniref:GNAT family N-acetyltransferase n=1 Tax=Allomuricauda sp. ANG21 TaxID=3042468 RepID=UPI0034551406
MIKSENIRVAERDEAIWINSQYAAIGFPESHFDNEYIMIAENGSQKVGLGRLAPIDHNNIELGGIYVLPSFRGGGVAEKLVRALIETNPYKGRTIWCLPFKNLVGFYKKFGFQISKSSYVPPRIVTKYNWCNSPNRFDEEVLLLVKP